MTAKALLLMVGVLGFLAFAGFGIWAAVDMGNLDLVNPVPTTAPMTEIDLAAHVDDNQVEMAKDATGKISMVAMAGYSTVTSIVGMHTFRDIAVIIGICFISYVWLKGKKK